MTPDDEQHPVIDAYLAGAESLTAFAIGGPAARAYPAATRLSGPTREATAIVVAEEFFDDPVVAGLARRDDFADALTGGAHIGRLGGPMLLTSTGSLHEAPDGYLCAQAASIRTVFVYGGEGAISSPVLEAAAARAAGEGC